MGMPMELNTMIVTKGNEERVGENEFALEKSGYRLYPLDIPIDIRTTKEGENRGRAIIKKIEWSKETTFLTYEFISLKSTN
jgi:hypothetical protein